MKFILFSLIFVSISCSNMSTFQSVDKNTQNICENHIFHLNIAQLKKVLIQLELEAYKRDRINNKQHPFYNLNYFYNGKDHEPIEQSYLFGKLMRQYALEDPLIHFAEVESTKDTFTIVTTRNIYLGTKIGIIQSKLKVLSFNHFVIKTKKKIFQQSFPMTINYIDLDDMIKKSKRNFAAEVDMIQNIEPNTFKKYFP